MSASATSRALPASAGQASVEFVALLPVLLLLAVGAWQLVVAGHAMWAADAAARAAARAQAVGGDPVAAARERLTPALESGLRLRHSDGWVRVSVRIPRVLPVAVGRVSARARFGEDGA